MEFKIPTWEAAKEIANKLPGGGPADDDAKCPKCGYDLDKDSHAKKDKKGY